MKTLSLILAATLAASALAGCIAELDLAETESELEVGQWQANVRVPDQGSARQPGIAWFNNRVHMVHNGGDDSTALWYSVRDEARKTWSTNVKIQNLRADGGPSLVVWNAKLTMIFRSGSKLMMSQMNANQTWTAAAEITSGITVKSAPSAVVAGGKLFVGYCADDGDTDGPHIDMLDRPNGQWFASWSHPGGDDCQTVALGTSGSTLFAAWTTYWDHWWSSEMRYLLTVNARLTGGMPAWDRDIVSQPMKSRKPMSIVGCGAVTHFVHGGGGSDDANNIYWSTFQNGAWLPDVQVPNQLSNGGAQLGCAAGTTAFMIHNGDSAYDLWYSEFR